MANYETVPKAEAEPLVAAAPKTASPKFKAAALAILLASAVAGYQAPAVVGKYLSFRATGGENLPYPKYSYDVSICLADGSNHCLGVPNKGNNGLNKYDSSGSSYIATWPKTRSPKQGIQLFTFEYYESGGGYYRRLRFKSKDGRYNGCVGIAGDKFQNQKCHPLGSSRGESQEVYIPGDGDFDETGEIDFYEHPSICMGPPCGPSCLGAGENHYVFADHDCDTQYKIEVL